MQFKTASPVTEDSPFVLAPRQERSRAALRKIITAAVNVIRERGTEGFSMADVARASGIPVASIYRRFRGKEDLILAIKMDATLRIEETIAHQLAGHIFSNIQQVVSMYAAATTHAFARDEAMHHMLFNLPANRSQLNEIGISGRNRIFSQYRIALLAFLTNAPAKHQELLVTVSFQIVASAILSKVKSNNTDPSDLSWDEVATEFSQAAISYLEASLTRS